MKFDRQTTASCIVQPPPPPDPRCADASFALAHPDICSFALIIKPSVGLLCLNESVQFRVYEFANGVETELTTGVTFTSSNPGAFVKSAFEPDTQENDSHA